MALLARPNPVNPPVSSYLEKPTSAVQLYDTLLAQLMAHPSLRVESVLVHMLSASSSMKISDRLAQIDQLKAWLDSFRPLQATVLAELKQRYDVRFTYSSNAIEGNTLSQSETELVLSKGITIGGKTLAEHLEVIGHKEAIDYIETLAQAETPLSDWDIRQIHNLVLRRISPTEAGRYRQLDVKAAGTEHLYPPHYLLPGLMADFIEWLSANRSATHPVEYASEAHYRFVSIHPFTDGNGRTGRLLMNLLLLKAGFPIVSISNQKREDYIVALSTAQQSQDDLTLLLALICEATCDSLIETLSVVASATESKGKGGPFYQEVVNFLSRNVQSTRSETEAAAKE
jgi:Fic family protein